MENVRITLSDWVSLFRPTQWAKNSFIFLPLVFGGRLFDPAAIFHACAAFALFSLAASAVYLANDVFDAPYDKLHPVKRRRAVASGLISPVHALKLEAEAHVRDTAAKGLKTAIIRSRTVIGAERLGIFYILFEWIREGHRVYIGWCAGAGPRDWPVRRFTATP